MKKPAFKCQLPCSVLAPHINASIMRHQSITIRDDEGDNEIKIMRVRHGYATADYVNVEFWPKEGQ